jgi:hypothetical protein
LINSSHLRDELRDRHGEGATADGIEIEVTTGDLDRTQQSGRQTLDHVDQLRS